MTYNQLRIEAYTSGTTYNSDIQTELDQASGLSFSTGYNGGLYLDASFYIPRDVVRWWELNNVRRIIIRNGLEVVYEGKVDLAGNELQGSSQGVKITATGYWGSLLGRRRWRKVWCDNRMDANTWKFNEGTSGADKVTIDHTDQIKFVPKDVEWLTSDVATLTYQMPTGETIKRLTFDYDLDEEAQWSPEAAFHNDDPGGANTFTAMTNAIDNDTSTVSTRTYTSDDYIYIKLHRTIKCTALRFDIGATPNDLAATMAAQYYEETSETWKTLTIVDGTLSGGKTLKVDGDMTFTEPADIGEVSVNDDRGKWVRLQPSANLTAGVTIREIYVIAAQQWKLQLYNVTTASEAWSVTTTGSGSADQTLATPSQQVNLRFIPSVKQTPPGDGTIYAKVTNMKVYSETGSINLTEIAKDIRAKISDLNSYEGLIDSNTLSLVPFYADSWDESVADILARAASFGDSSYNSWAVGVAHSEKATTPNGEPVLFVEQYPALTDYDYAIRVDEANLAPPISIERDYSNVWNWIIVEYSDINGVRTYLTPDDDANLTNAASVAAYGQRDYTLKAPSGDATTAANLGRAFLVKYKDPQYVMSGPIQVVGYIRTKAGKQLPASQICAGKRIKIENYLSDLSGTGLTFLITRTTYSDDDEKCSIESGIPSALEVLLAQLAGS